MENKAEAQGSVGGGGGEASAKGEGGSVPREHGKAVTGLRVTAAASETRRAYGRRAERGAEEAEVPQPGDPAFCCAKGS